MATGTVKFFNAQKGFGFIVQDNGGPDVFVHISAVERAGMHNLNEGQKLSFDVQADQRSGKSAKRTAMPKKPGTNPKGEFVFFDVAYEDGSQRSNRRVPAELLGGLEKDAPARGFIIEQDREIAEKSGRPVLAIKSIRRSDAKNK